MGGSSLSLDDSHAVQLAGLITMIAVLVLFFVLVLLLLCLHLYAKRYHSNVLDHPTSSAEAPKLRGGLDPLVVNSLTLIVVGSGNEEGLECAVCLSDVVEGDKARLLPKCQHGFHVECIDMWFQSHSTCPLCRSSVVEASLASGFSSESPIFPTNVLFWGDQTRVSSGGPGNASSSDARQEPSEESGMVAVALAARLPLGNGGFGAGEEDLKSPVVATRLRSLKRLLSRDRRVVSACSPSAADVDVEEGR